MRDDSFCGLGACNSRLQFGKRKNHALASARSDKNKRLQEDSREEKKLGGESYDRSRTMRIREFARIIPHALENAATLPASGIIPFPSTILTIWGKLHFEG